MLYLQFRGPVGSEFDVLCFAIMRTIAFEIYHKVDDFLYKIGYCIVIDYITKFYFIGRHLKFKVIF